MYKKKAPFFAIDFIFSNGPNFYITNGPANWVKFDRDLFPDTCLKNMKKNLLVFYLCSGVWIVILNALLCCLMYSLYIE